MWDPDAHLGMLKPSAPPADMPRGSTNKAHGNTLYAHIVDIRSAWRRADLELQERQALLLHYGADFTEQQTAALLSRSRSTIQYHLYRGVGKIVAHLNGSEFIEELDQQVA